MNTFSIDVAAYDGTGTDPNPIVWIHGFVNGQSSGYWQVFYQTIAQANQVGGVSAVRLVLAPILSAVFGPPYPPVPVYPAQVAPAPRSSPNNQTTTRIPSTLYTSVVDFPEALAAGSWSA